MSNLTRIVDVVAELRADGCLTNIDRLILGDAREDAQTLNALEQRLARTEKGLLARGARSQRMMFATPVTK